MKLAWPRSLCTRRLCRALASITLVVLAAVLINALGIGLVGDIDGWTRWLEQRAGYFFAWRLCIYSATAYGWWKLRSRLRERDPSPEARRRLLRAEIGAIASLALLEASVLLRE